MVYECVVCAHRTFAATLWFEADMCNVVRMYDYVMSLNVRARDGADKEIMRIITAYR